VRIGGPRYTFSNAEMTPAPAGVTADTTTCTNAAVAGAMSATEIRCHDDDADEVVTDQLMLISAEAAVSHLSPIRSGTVAPDASANAMYSVPAVTGYEATVRACISPAAVLVSFRVPSPFRPPVPREMLQLSLATQPDVFGSTDSVVGLRRLPGIATAQLTPFDSLAPR
jgi:hypothetical protein